MTYLFSLELILEVDPIECLILQVLLSIPQLLYNREEQTTVIRDSIIVLTIRLSIMVLTIRVSIMVLYNVVDPVWIGSDPHPFTGSGSGSRACQSESGRSGS